MERDDKTMQEREEIQIMDAYLSRRPTPATPPDLAQRIIHAAMRVAQEPLPDYKTVWAEFRAMISIPHPSYALAAGIVLGLLMGFQAGDGMSMLQQQDWSSFLDVNEGGWL